VSSPHIARAAHDAADMPWDAAEFERQLRAKGQAYHIHHPFNVMLNSGRASREQVRGWVANRFYYQINIPRKDAAILANCPDREQRRLWVQRILDHDGSGEDAGGIEAWLRLGEAVGLTSDELWSLRQVVPGVRFAVDAYVNFARQQPWQEAVCASLTELFAPQIRCNSIALRPQRWITCRRWPAPPTRVSHRCIAFSGKQLRTPTCCCSPRAWCSSTSRRGKS
jgi:pyrroloquinoline-quinone synthase